MHQSLLSTQKSSTPPLTSASLKWEHHFSRCCALFAWGYERKNERQESSQGGCSWICHGQPVLARVRPMSAMAEQGFPSSSQIQQCNLQHQITQHLLSIYHYISLRHKHFHWEVYKRIAKGKFRVDIAKAIALEIKMINITREVYSSVSAVLHLHRWSSACL